ncbi:multidrug effflux MFS transporter [Massilia sp. LXY-6]|uniref:multidrug effflux MFS transporter n=1 Tax=Massilia sp. LXY-6 TaxID=3379823 RepID=UPI003EE1651E
MTTLPPSSAVVQRLAPPIWLLVVVTMSSTLAMHMFVPALPYAAHELGAGMATMQMTISLYIIGLAVGQLFYGPMSDAYGRRPMLMAGLGLYTAAGLFALCATGVHSLIAARLLQALGGCAGLALGRAIIRDSARSDQAMRQLAQMNLMMMIGPGLAPLVGGAVATLFGWRAIFVVLALLGALTLACAWRLLPETGTPSGVMSPKVLLNDYRWLLRSPVFVGFTLGGGCSTTSVYGFIAAAPFILTTQLHRPLHEVGFYLALLIVGMSLGNALTGRLAGRLPASRLLLGSNILSLVSAVAFLLTVMVGGLTLVGTMGLLFAYTVGAGMSSPAALSKAVGVNRQLVGSASGLYGSTQMAIGALCTSLAAVGRNPALAVACVLVGAAGVGQVSFWVALTKEQG